MDTHTTLLSLPYSLRWDLEGLEEELEHSKNNLRQMIQDSDLVLIKTYGKAVPKKCRLSPDGWFQVRNSPSVEGTPLISTPCNKDTSINRMWL